MQESPLGVVPSVVFLYDREPTFELARALDKVRANKSISFTQVPANAVTCECFQRVRVPALLLYNIEGVETAAAVGTKSIISLVEQQF